MFCDGCGAKVDTGQRFCPTCGRTLTALGATPSGAAPAFYPPPPRVAANIKLLGILWLVYSGLHLIPILGLIAIVAGATAGAGNIFGPDVPAFVPLMLEGIGVALCAALAVGLLAGWGLLHWKNWGRLLAIVLAIFSLISFPFGTALGIYTLWVLMPAESEREYQQHALVGA
jgi:hypothetical protein